MRTLTLIYLIQFTPILCEVKFQNIIRLLKDKDFIKLGSYSDLIFITDSKVKKEFQPLSWVTKSELPTFSIVMINDTNYLSSNTLDKRRRLEQIYIYYLTNYDILSKCLEQLIIQINSYLQDGMVQRKFLSSPTFIFVPMNFDSELITSILLSNSSGLSISKLNAISLASKFYWLSSTEEQEFTIYETYFLNPSRLDFNLISSGNIGIPSLSRMNLSGCLVKAIAPEKNLTQGEVSWGSKTNGELYFESGFGVDIFRALQDSLFFESKAIPTDGWATQFPNRSWASGMAKEVIEGRADFGLAKTSILAYRAESLAYLTPVHTLIVTAFFQQPSSASLRNIFILPFESELWFYMFTIWLILLFFQSFLGFVKEKYYPETVHHSDKDTMEENLIWIISAICQHGLYKTPVSISHRIIFFVGYVFGLVNFVAYSATLMSIFTTPNIPIKTIFDLIQSPLKLLVDMNSAGAKLVVSEVGNSSITHSKITKLLIEKVGKGGGKDTFISASNGTSVIIKSGKIRAFMSFTDTFYTTFRNDHGVSDKFLCDKVSSVTVSNIPFRSGLFLRKNSPYKKIFNIKIVNLYTSGLIHKYVENYEEKYVPRCGNSVGIESSPALELSHVLSLILFMSFGIAFSLFLCISEHLIKKVKRKYLNSKNNINT